MAKGINKLSARQVAALSKPGRHSDGGGLYLRITQAGQRSWQFMATRSGSRMEIGLGPERMVSLAAARRVAEQMREALAVGEDPRLVIGRNGEGRGRSSAKEVDQGTPDVDRAPTFGDFADTILADILPGFKNAKHRQQWANTLKAHGAPLQAMRIDAITTDDVLGVIRPLWATKNETASRLRGRIERILGAAKAKGLRPVDSMNPAAWGGHLEHFLPLKRKHDKGHHASVPWGDMPAFWTMLAARRNSTSVEALRFTILTACRTGEVIGARWSEVDLDAQVWAVPKERMKMGIAHSVPLSPAAVAVLERMQVGVGPDDYVFPGLKADRPITNMAMLKLLQRDLGRPETVHGFRSSFRDWAGDGTSFPRELAEQALAHAIGDKAEQAYRRGTAIERRRPLMEAWADYLAGDNG